MKRTLAVLLLALAAACSRSPASAAASAAAAVPAAAAAPRDAKALLADARAVAGFAAYQKEMAPHTAKAMEIFAAAYAKAGGDAAKIEQAAKDDPRIAEFNKLDEAALARAGLGRDDVRILGQALSTYMAEVAIAQGATDEAAQVAAAEQKLAALYGPAAVESVRKQQAALVAAQLAALEAMTKK
jgi:hypothetical protein